jgi:transposase InsO family protein
MGLRGAVRGKETKTTITDKATPCPADKVNRQFRAPQPNVLWVSDFTYVATWQGFVYVAFVIDVFARRIVGWRVSRTAHADFVLDALEQALHDRRPPKGGLIHHSDKGGRPGSTDRRNACLRRAQHLIKGFGRAFSSRASCAACR